MAESGAQSGRGRSAASVVEVVFGSSMHVPQAQTVCPAIRVMPSRPRIATTRSVCSRFRERADEFMRGRVGTAGLLLP